MNENPLSICIIGFGAFGQLLARLLRPHAGISVMDPSKKARAAACAARMHVIERPEDVTADIVLLAVPLPALKRCLEDIAPHLRPGQIIADVCSIKEKPAQMMEHLLPPFVEIVATHPMFGPNSAGADLAGLQVVICPIRGNGWRRPTAFLRRVLRAETIITTPEDHDRQTALTQGLTHLLARGLSILGDHPRIGTKSSLLLAEALAMVEHDAPEVFDAVTRGNRHVAPIWQELSQVFQGLIPPEDTAR
ncbi:prephenate dehydrogenase [uncultured Roseovarius sp.]|mgnify:CR=1 FL=1|uniref:prephenate dehydrogenase n=1 Tax=Roseovarius sp. TaxID=1486281 RepID=UPI0025D787AE|nr:prephenate dehydrogenase [uncultured Roseovarius sp.]